MSKSVLNELCIKNKWQSPVYSTTKHGPDHIPTFHATVTVNDATFASESVAKSSKEAQNDAARIAVLQLTAAAAAASADCFLGIQHMYKSNLQIYAQKRNFLLPVYAPERHGPPHASQFRCSVTIDGQTYRSEELFPTLKDAEHEELMYKSLLQEKIQKKGGCLPNYETRKLGQVNAPTFISTVEVEGQAFTGHEAKSKKLAEMSAAKVAYTHLMEGNSSGSPIQPFPASEEQEPLPLCPQINSVILAHLDQQVQPKLHAPGNKAGDVPSMLNPSSGSNVATSEPSASSMDIQTYLYLNNKIREKPLAIPSSSNCMEQMADTVIAMTGTEPSVMIPSLESSSVIVKPPASPTVGPSSSSPIRVPDHASTSLTLPCPPSATHPTVLSNSIIKHQNGGTAELPASMPSATPAHGDSSWCVQHLIRSSVGQPNRIVIHPRNISVTYPDGSTVLPMNDNNWVAVKSSSQSTM
ncbi:Double-stranded RNA-binding protein 4 [Linum perenne]